MEFVQHDPLIENGCRRIAVRRLVEVSQRPKLAPKKGDAEQEPERDASGDIVMEDDPVYAEDFIDIPVDDLLGKSDDEVVEMILAGRDALAATYAQPVEAEAKAEPVDDAVSRALARIAKQAQ